MTDSLPKGIRARSDAEDLEFMRFFSIVQEHASRLGSTFFLWSAEAHDGLVADVWCEDLSGWLVPSGESGSFESLWLARDPRIWADEFDDFQVFARWSNDASGNISITFDHPLRTGSAFGDGTV